MGNEQGRRGLGRRLQEQVSHTFRVISSGQPAASSGTASGREANMGQRSGQVSIHQGSFHISVATVILEQRVLTVASCFQRRLALRQADPSGTRVTETPGPRSERSLSCTA